MTKGKIIVGMSGGVDSSVCAYLLKREGWDVLGVFMKNWEDDERDPVYRVPTSGCTWEQDYADVRAVCDKLDIPYTTFNFVAEYRQRVFSVFLEELKAGRTPNPDIVCNQEVKFHLFLQKALQQEGVTAIATGHYARLRDGRLCRPLDLNKDQTYFLHRIDPAQFPHIVFPLADLTKQEVRAIAREQGFPNADKKDSVGICFIGNIDYREFISQHIPQQPGTIETLAGVEVGKHQGLHLYTIGQRKGIEIGGTGPYYVVRKDYSRNVLLVTNTPDDPALLQTTCVVDQMHWLVPPTEVPQQCSVQVRYRQQAQSAQVTVSGDHKTVTITFDQPQRAITPGQSAVLYDGDVVLGGGVIESAE